MRTLLYFTFIILGITPNIVLADPIDCESKKLSRVEKKICNSEELKHLDERFDSFYSRIKNTKGGLDFNQSNSEWQLERSHCLTDDCLKTLYKKLTDEVINIYVEQNPRYQELRKECQELNIPPECEVYSYDDNDFGLDIDYAEFAIDENYETHVKHIKVNRPNKCVVLALNSFQPTVWKIYYTPQTKIYGVILAYRDRNQMLQGVPVGTKVWRNQCLDGSVFDAYISGLADDNVIAMKSNEIGTKLSDEFYMHQARNIDVTATIQQELPNHEALRALVSSGVLRFVDEKDVSFLIDRGYSMIDGWGDDVFLSHWKSMYRHMCSDPVRFSHSSICHYYILEKPLEKLPRGLDGVYGVVIFTPEGMDPPKRGEHTTSSIMRMHGTLKELNKFRKAN